MLVSNTPGAASTNALSSVLASLPIVCAMRSPEIVTESTVWFGWKTEFAARVRTAPIVLSCFESTIEPSPSVWSPILKPGECES